MIIKFYNDELRASKYTFMPFTATKLIINSPFFTSAGMFSAELRATEYCLWHAETYAHSSLKAKTQTQPFPEKDAKN